MVLPATLLLLAGGASRRMGRPKALLPVAGTTLIEWLAGRLAPGFEELLVAGRDRDQLPPRLREHFLPDRRPGGGPMAGIETGLAATRHPALVAVACDMPYVTPELAARLVRAVDGYAAAVPRVEGRPEPACAAYTKAAAAAIATALDSGRPRAAGALEQLRVNWLDGEDPTLFTNLNTPAEYEAFLDTARKTG